MRNFDQVAQHMRDQLLETLAELMDKENVVISQVAIKPNLFSIQFVDETDEKVKYDLPIRRRN